MITAFKKENGGVEPIDIALSAQSLPIFKGVQINE
jgi:hypothetical protein